MKCISYCKYYSSKDNTIWMISGDKEKSEITKNDLNEKKLFFSAKKKKETQVECLQNLDVFFEDSSDYMEEIKNSNIESIIDSVLLQNIGYLGGNTKLYKIRIGSDKSLLKTVRSNDCRDLVYCAVTVIRYSVEYKAID